MTQFNRKPGSAIFLPAEKPKQPKRLTQLEIRREYDKLHAVCPECGHDDISQTCMGFIWCDLESAVDSNLADCRCGWNGITHDLVPLQTEQTMYERFTDRARKVMQLANQEAQRFNHEYIGTEHILLGLIKEGSGVAANVLKNLDVDLRKIRLEVEKLVRRGSDILTMGKLPITPRAKKVIEFTMMESRDLSHNYVGTEHLLLGMLRESEGVAAVVLITVGLTLESVRSEIRKMLGDGRTAYCSRIFECSHIDEVLGFIKLIRKVNAGLISVVALNDHLIRRAFMITYRHDKDIPMGVRT